MSRTHQLFSRHNRYLLAIGGLALAAAGLAGAAFAITEAGRQDLIAADARSTELRGTTAELSDAFHAQDSAVDDYLLVHSPDSLDRYSAAVDAEATLALKLRAATAELPDYQRKLEATTAANRSWRTHYAEPALAAAQANDTAALTAILSSGDHELVETLVRGLMTELDDHDADLAQRERALSATRTISTMAAVGCLLVTAGIALWLVRRYGRELELDAAQAGILNRFTEVASFAADDASVAQSNLTALGLLVAPTAAVTHVFNRSKDRAIPEAALGDATPGVLTLSALNRCSGMVRGSMYVTDDLAAPLSVHCPVYPETTGTLACVPLNSGESVGAVHLYWNTPDALPLEMRASVMRIAEHAALAIGNRRLLAVLQGQANTDPRTGLANSRSFDEALEAALAARADPETIAVLMLDLDHFKDFNDRYGHPAGDEALRAFAGVLRSCVRDGDLAARYGGEEFAVLLPNVDEDAAHAIAERIRSRTESTVISLAPGLTDRITVSIGLAMAPPHGVERVALLRVADQALYRAKSDGRNRVHLFSAGNDGGPERETAGRSAA